MCCDRPRITKGVGTCTARVRTIVTAAPPTRVSACFLPRHCAERGSDSCVMASACFRLKRLLLGPFLSRAPNPPTELSVVPRSDGFDVSWRAGASTSEYNNDRYEVEMAPTSPRLLELLGDAFGSHVQFYSGTDRACSIDRLQPSQPFSIRARCVNRAGTSRWVAIDAETCQVPVRCGGVGPDSAYAWDQTPTHVEVRVPVPPTLAPRAVDVRVRPRRLEVRLENREVIAGALGGEVTCQPGDFEWEMRDAAPEDDGDTFPRRATRELFIVLEKALPADGAVEYDPMRQWDRLFTEPGHARIDRRAMRWTRDGEWRPPQDAASPDQVARALPDMHVFAQNQTGVAGRDGELDDWGMDWEKKKKAKKAKQR